MKLDEFGKKLEVSTHENEKSVFLFSKTHTKYPEKSHFSVFVSFLQEFWRKETSLMNSKLGN